MQDTPTSVLFTGAAVTGLGDHRGCRSAVFSWSRMRCSLQFRCFFFFPWNIFFVVSFSSGLIVLLKSQPSSLPFPACHVVSSAFSTLSAQAEQLVPKETGGWLPGKIDEWFSWEQHWKPGTGRGPLPAASFGAGPPVWLCTSCLYFWRSNKQPLSRSGFLEWFHPSMGAS